MEGGQPSWGAVGDEVMGRSTLIRSRSVRPKPFEACGGRLRFWARDGVTGSVGAGASQGGEEFFHGLRDTPNRV